MFREMVIEALSRSNSMSGRAASELAGKNETWLKSILRAKNPVEPKIGSVARLAIALQIDPKRLLEAAARDFPGKKAKRTQRVEAALQALPKMTPQERAAFVAALQAQD